MTPDTLLNFWFKELTPQQWFNGGDAVDLLIRERFSDWLEGARQGEYEHWRNSAHGRLAEIIGLDQFSRNIYRNTPQAFAQDPLALALAQEAIRSGEHQQLSAEQRVFLYMPFMHSESRKIHETAERLFRENGIENNYQYELQHKVIIDRFGRYPHRNAILGRESSAEEIEFLQQPGSSF